MKYYLIESKSDDYGACNMGVIYEKETKIKKRVHYYKEIPKEDYEVLKKYLENVNHTDYQVFGYKTLGEYLEEYF